MLLYRLECKFCNLVFNTVLKAPDHLLSPFLIPGSALLQPFPPAGQACVHSPMLCPGCCFCLNACPPGLPFPKAWLKLCTAWSRPPNPPCLGLSKPWTTYAMVCARASFYFHTGCQIFRNSWTGIKPLVAWNQPWWEYFIMEICKCYKSAFPHRKPV